jgi:D-alanyl-D-alanine carboxypeptidase
LSPWGILTNTRTERSRSRALRIALIGTAAAVTAGGALAVLPTGARTTDPAAIRARNDAVLQRGADAAVEAGSSGYLARFQDGVRVRTAVAELAGRKTGHRLRADDRFEIGGNTETFTATMIMQLVAEGRIHLDDALEQYLPGRFPKGKKITVKVLLNHTSGLYSYTDEAFV